MVLAALALFAFAPEAGAWAATASDGGGGSGRPQQAQIPDPPAYGATPSEKQIAWQELEYYGFIHYGLNTYTGQEWGLGSEKPSLFNPSSLEPAEWAETAKNARMKGLILVVKHHSGFALWPSEHTEYSVKNSPWKSGQGDVLKELADACREQGIKLGIYYSPWDRNSPYYGVTAEERDCREGRQTANCPESVSVGEPDDYVIYMRNQLREVLNQEKYGDIFELWLDGAKVPRGYYKGYDPTRTDYNPAPSPYLEGDQNPDNSFLENRVFWARDYDWPGTAQLALELQPHTMIFGGDPGKELDKTGRWLGPHIHWEPGGAKLQNWSTRKARRYIGPGRAETIAVWRPVETETSIRRGWFWQPGSPKNLRRLHQMYYASVGRNSTFLLNLAIDTDGNIPPEDVVRLNELKSRIDEDFRTNLALEKEVQATDARNPGASSKFKPGNVTDGDTNTYWATNDGVTSASVTIDFGEPTEFNRLVIQEYIRLGQRVEEFSIEYESAPEQWERVPVYYYNFWPGLTRIDAPPQGGDEQTTIGYKRILHFDTVQSSKVKVNILAAKASPLISNIEVFRAPDNTDGIPRNTRPEITSPGAFVVPENRTVVGLLTARDDDAGDEVTGWAIAGGADEGQFEITSDTGELRFRTAPDYEDPVDVASTDPLSGAEDNQYVVTVEVRSGAGTRELTAEQTVTVTVTDQREPPEAPLTLEITSGTEPPVSDAFTVRFSFSEPVNSFNAGDIQRDQNPACVDDQNIPVGCDPQIGNLQTGDNRVYTTTVRPETAEVAHSYTLTLTVEGDDVRSSVGNKGNEEAMLAVRVSPPGAPEPISSAGLRASPGNGSVRLGWNRPSEDGGSAIIRYEYRYAPTGETWSEWKNVGASAPGVTVGGLINGREYVFEVRAVNALGKGAAETAMATPVVGSGGGGFGGGGPITSAPGAPENLTAAAGDGEVVLSWDAPASDGGAAITDYEYRIDRTIPWISIGSTNTTHTVSGLSNGTTYVFEVRAVNRIGSSSGFPSAEATPEAPEVFTLNFTHLANGAGITSDLVFVNLASRTIRSTTYFYDTEGDPIAAQSVVEVTDDTEEDSIATQSVVEATDDPEAAEDGSLSIQTEMAPLSELTIATHGRGDLVTGSVTVVSDGPMGGMLRYGLPHVGEAVVGASTPTNDAVFPVRRQQDGVNTGVALHNLESSPETVRCELRQAGVLLEAADISLGPNGQTSWPIDEAFPSADTSAFVGTVRCTATGEGLFTVVALEMDSDKRIFTTLPVVAPVGRPGGTTTVLNFTHLANGTGITSDLVFVNRSTQPSRQALTPFDRAIPPTRPVIYFYDREGNAIAPEMVVDVAADLEITAEGALTVRTEMAPLSELTIATHGRGDLVTGSVTVVSDGPMGGMLRYGLPHVGEAVVGASTPRSDAVFPVRRQQGGINTGVALHNLESSPETVRCELRQAGVQLEAADISLGPNGQTSWLIDEAFPGTDTSAFMGTVRCTATGEGLFTAVALEMDSDKRIFTILPVEERRSQE